MTTCKYYDSSTLNCLLIDPTSEAFDLGTDVPIGSSDGVVCDDAHGAYCDYFVKGEIDESN